MTDLETLEHVAAATWDLVRLYVFPGSGGWLVKDLPDRTLDGKSFRVEFRLQQDLLGTTAEGPEPERTMVVLRFAPAGEPMPDFPWGVRVRGHWPERARFAAVGPLRARKLRKSFSPRRRQSDDRYPAESDDIFLMEEAPHDVCL